MRHKTIDYIPYMPEHADAIVNLWNEAFRGEFPLDLRLWRQNVDDCDRTDWGASYCALAEGRIVGAVVAKRPGHIGAILVAPEFRRQGIGSALLQLGVDGLMPEPGARISAGADYLHFFPGIPETCLAALGFFSSSGWNIVDAGACWDLIRNIEDYEVPESVKMKTAELARQGIVIRPCAKPDVDALLAHVEANFSARWLSETLARTEMEPAPDEIIIAVRGQEVVGFCQTFSTRSVKLGPSVYWRGLLGNHYGGLGPIGVARDVRKIGLGLALLCWSVDAVKKTGATRMAIDWTVLIDFYGRIGFTPWKRYVPASRTF